MLLAAVLLLTLCACGKGAAPDVTPAPEPSAGSAETLSYDVPCAVTAQTRLLFSPVPESTASSAFSSPAAP